LKVHLVLALSAVSTTLWHAILLNSVEARIATCIACGSWTLSVVYRWAMISFRGRRARIIDFWRDDTVIGIEVEIDRGIRPVPGGYFRVFFPGSIFRYDIFDSYPLIAIWNERELLSVEGARSISFIMCRSQYSRRMEMKIAVGNYLILEGPFGHDLHLQSSYENVVFTAKGIGILGILPLAFHIATRRRHDDMIRGKLQGLAVEEQELAMAQNDLVERSRRMLSQEEKELIEKERDLINTKRESLPKRKEFWMSKPLFCDVTRKVDIFWTLDNNSQGLWVQRHIEALKQLDPNNVSLEQIPSPIQANGFQILLVLWCMNPSPRIGLTPFKVTDHFICVYPAPNLPEYDRMIISKVEEESRSPGKIVVIGMLLLARAGSEQISC
jgi:hypothetical protein